MRLHQAFSTNHVTFNLWLHAPSANGYRGGEPKWLTASCRHHRRPDSPAVTGIGAAASGPMATARCMHCVRAAWPMDERRTQIPWDGAGSQSLSRYIRCLSLYSSRPALLPDGVLLALHSLIDIVACASSRASGGETVDCEARLAYCRLLAIQTTAVGSVSTELMRIVSVLNLRK